MTTNQAKIITVSRELASGGAYIGHLIARKLGWQYVEREVLHAAAKDLGVDIRDVSNQDEKKSGFIENLVKSFLFGSPDGAYVPPARRPVYDEELFAAECRIIKQIAERRNAVIVGHAGFTVLAGLQHVFNVHIHAPREFRIARLRKFHSLSAEQALAEIEESDRRKEEYLRTRTGRNWHDARNYHLCLDASAAGFDASADTIIALAQAGALP